MTAPLHPPVLVIGVGNDLRGDDAAGRRVVSVAEGWNRPGVRFIQARQLVPELAGDVAAAASVVLVDAAVGGADAPSLTPVAADATPAALSHRASLGALLALARLTEGHAPEGWELAIPGDVFAPGSPPSPRCRAGIAAAIGVLKEVLPGASDGPGVAPA